MPQMFTDLSQFASEDRGKRDAIVAREEFENYLYSVTDSISEPSIATKLVSKQICSCAM